MAVTAAARIATIEEHLPLVRHIVFQVAVHFPRHVDREELARAGTLGLVEAAQRFDETRGVPFQRFAAQRIRGAILDAVRAADWAPRSLRTSARALDTTTNRLASELGRAPSTDEVADAMATTPEQLARLQSRIHRSVVLALDHETDGDDDVSLRELITDATTPEPAEVLETRELRGYLRDAIALLPARHRLVVIGYFLEGRTSAELACLLGVTESRISQLRSEAVETLRAGIAAQYGAEAATDGSAAGRRRSTFAAALADRTPWRDRVAG